MHCPRLKIGSLIYVYVYQYIVANGPLLYNLLLYETKEHTFGCLLNVEKMKFINEQDSFKCWNIEDNKK